ncbi:class I SAM-dependent methyltransferase [soil metagenome]
MELWEDIQGQAIYDFWVNEKAKALKVHNSYGVPEKMPVEVFFKTYQDLPEVDKYALNICKGHILDVGAGAGKHALALQDLSKKVTAIELSPLSAEVMRQRGVIEVIEQDIFKFSGLKFDTILMLMNGIGLAGSLEKLEILMQHVKNLLHPKGQWIFDSSDISYLYPKGQRLSNPYYGEIHYRFEYKKLKGRWFHWLYLDRKALKQYARKTGWNMQIIYENDEDEFLARLTLAV